MMLKVNDLSVSYGEVPVLHGVSLEVHEGELVVVIGSNGAGKSTLVRSIMGLVKPTAGEILFMGEHMEHMKSQDIVKKGLCLILEGRQLFAEMTVEEHLLMGAYTHRKNKDEVEKNLRRVYNLFPVLEENKNRIASSFSGGEQQMITLGRGLMLDPKLLIIDEMSLGLAPKVISTLFALSMVFRSSSVSRSDAS